MVRGRTLDHICLRLGCLVRRPTDRAPRRSFRCLGEECPVHHPDCVARAGVTAASLEEEFGLSIMGVLGPGTRGHDTHNTQHNAAQHLSTHNTEPRTQHTQHNITTRHATTHTTQHAQRSATQDTAQHLNTHNTTGPDSPGGRGGGAGEPGEPGDPGNQGTQGNQENQGNQGKQGNQAGGTRPKRTCARFFGWMPAIISEPTRFSITLCSRCPRSMACLCSLTSRRSTTARVHAMVPSPGCARS